MKIDYNRPKGNITRMHVFLASCYLFDTKIEGSYCSPKNEEDVVESVKHFKFLTKYWQYFSLI